MRFIPGTQGWLNIWKSINIIHHISKLTKKNHMIISIEAQEKGEGVRQINIWKIIIENLSNLVRGVVYRFKKRVNSNRTRHKNSRVSTSESKSWKSHVKRKYWKSVDFFLFLIQNCGRQKITKQDLWNIESNRTLNQEFYI